VADAAKLELSDDWTISHHLMDRRSLPRLRGVDKSGGSKRLSAVSFLELIATSVPSLNMGSPRNGCGGEGVVEDRAEEAAVCRSGDPSLASISAETAHPSCPRS
jgi:hypothetical protein